MKDKLYNFVRSHQSTVIIVGGCFISLVCSLFSDAAAVIVLLAAMGLLFVVSDPTW